MSRAGRSALIESSVVACQLRRVIPASRSAVIDGWRALVEGQSAPRPADIDVVRIVEETWLLGGLASLFEMIGRGWREAASTSAVAPAVRMIEALTPPDRVRLFGWILFVSALTTGLWRGLDGLVSWSILPSMTTMLIAVAVMRWSAAIAAAWADRFGHS